MPALLIWTKPLSLCTAGLVSPRTNFLSRHSCLTNSFPSLYFRSTSVSPLIPPSLCGACVISESLANQLHCALVWKSFAFRDGKQAAAMLCTAVASGWAWEAWRGLQTQCAALAPAKNLLQADGNAHSASGPIALQRTQSPRSPAPTTPYSSPSVDHEQGEASSQLTAHSSTAWPWGWSQPPLAPDQPVGMGSSHPGPRVELLAISEPCNVLKPSGPRDKAPLSSFSFFPEKAFLHNVHF